MKKATKARFPFCLGAFDSIRIKLRSTQLHISAKVSKSSVYRYESKRQLFWQYLDVCKKFKLKFREAWKETSKITDFV